MNFLSFEWLGVFLQDFFAYLRGWQIYDGVSMYSLLLSVCFFVVAIRALLLKR